MTGLRQKVKLTISDRDLLVRNPFALGRLLTDKPELQKEVAAARKAYMDARTQVPLTIEGLSAEIYRGEANRNVYPYIPQDFRRTEMFQIADLADLIPTLTEPELGRLIPIILDIIAAGPFWNSRGAKDALNQGFVNSSEAHRMIIERLVAIELAR